jgi:hypothetical protein
MNEEIWKDIYGYEGLYQVSDLGRIKSLTRRVCNSRRCYQKKEQDLRQSLNSNGYLHVTLSKEGKHKNFKIHQLIVICFLNHKPDGTNKIVTDHINNNKLDNRLCNIQLITNRLNTSKDIIGKSSNFTGVSLFKNGKFVSYIKYRGVLIYLGMFDTEIEASEYYQNAVKSIENGEEIVKRVRTKTSIYKGIWKCKKTNRWSTYYYCVKNKNKKFIGNFNTEQEAYEAREEYIQTITNK